MTAVERTRTLLSAQGLMAEVLQADVLAYQPDKPFDAIYEQTCLYALHPDHWMDYARQLRQWLNPKGTHEAWQLAMPARQSMTSRQLANLLPILAVLGSVTALGIGTSFAKQLFPLV